MTHHVSMIPNKIFSRFFSRNLAVQKALGCVFKVLNGRKPYKLKICIGKTVLQNKGEIKAFQDKQNLERIIIIRTSLPEILKGVLQAEMKKC